MSRVFIAAGSNVGDRLQHLETAFQSLSGESSLRILQRAPIYETAPVGGPEQGDFLNTLWVFETLLTPERVFEMMQRAEKSQGRIRAERNGPRGIDLDLAAYEEICFDQNGLRIPHERMHERWFVLKPFCDVAPQWKHPTLKKTAAELLSGLDRSAAGFLYETAQSEKK